MKKFLKLTVGAIAALGLAGGASASLSLYSSFSGAGVGVSTGGCGSLSQSCTLTANVPTTATILGVYIYSSMFGQTGSGIPGGTYKGPTTAATSYAPMTALGVNTAGGLQAYRRDVTADAVFGADIKGGNKTVTLTETNASQDGEAFVVVYADSAVSAVSTVFVFDGFSASGGDGFGFGVAATTATSTAEMRLGIGFSFDGTDPLNPTSTTQVSQVGVNGPLGNLTNVAGHCDDARWGSATQDATCSNGNLITVGGDNDAFTPSSPTVGQDHERYNLIPLLALGTTAVNVRTFNASNDDNIFLAVFKFSGVATCQVNCNNTVPEPISLALVGAGLLGLGLGRKKILKV